MDNKPMQWQRWQRRIWEGRGIFLTTPLAAGLVIALRGLGGLQFLEWDSLDLFFRWRPPEPTDPRIVLVAIREKDIRTLKQYPISDEVLARAIRNISQHQPRAIALDFYRDLPVHPGHQELLDVFATVPNLIGIEKVSNRGELSVPPPPLLQERDRVAAANLLIDKDGTIRRALLGVTLPQGGFRLSLGARMALEYLEAEGIPLETLPDYRVRLGQAVFIPFESSDGGYVRADDRGFQTLFNFRTRRCPPLPEFCQRFVTFSLSQVLAGEIPADLLRDRLVFIGTTAISIPDRFFTPYSSTYSMAPWGVEIHADLASMIISAAIDDRPLLRTLPESLEIASILLWSGIGSTLGWMFLRTRWKFFSLFLAGSSAVLFAYLAFLVGWWLPLVPSLVALALSEVAITVYIVYVEREDRLAIMNLLGQHVTPKIARAVWHERHDLLKKGQLVGTRLTATVLFTDLKDFTRISESLDPETLMVWLNDYMKTMSEVVLAQDGVVDKFIGDSVMAVFGVPLQRTTEEEIARDAKAAVRCAVRMVERLQKLNQQWQAKGLPTTTMRAGIATGIVVAGSLGSRQRLNYTIIGDTANVASRLESYNKSFGEEGSRILIGDRTYQYIREDFSTQFVDSAQLKGKSQPVKIYRVLGSAPDRRK